MSRAFAKRSTVVLAAAIALATAVTAGAAAVTVALNLQGGYANRTLKAPRFDALCGIAPSKTRSWFAPSLNPSSRKVRIQRPLCDDP